MARPHNHCLDNNKRIGFLDDSGIIVASSCVFSQRRRTAFYCFFSPRGKRDSCETRHTRGEKRASVPLLRVSCRFTHQLAL